MKNVVKSVGKGITMKDLEQALLENDQELMKAEGKISLTIALMLTRLEIYKGMNSILVTQIVVLKTEGEGYERKQA